MTRIEGWEVRLAAFLETRRERKFKRGAHDCVIFACDAIKEVSGVDLAADYRGKYTTKKKALEIIKSMGCEDLADVAERRLGMPLSSVTRAKRGDLVAVKYDGEIALGVVDMSGSQVATTGKDGIQYFSRKFWLKAWAV